MNGGYITILIMLIARSASAVCLMGYGGTCPPTEQTAKNVLEQVLNGEIHKCQVSQFNKTNGASQNFMGMEMYNMDWKAQLTCNGDIDIEKLEPCGKNSLSWDSCLRGRLYQILIPNLPMFSHDPFNGGKPVIRTLKTGASITGKFMFRQTENGWIYQPN